LGKIDEELFAFLAQYKKFDSHSDAQDFVDGNVKIQKTVETKSPTKSATSKSTNNIPAKLMQDTIKKFSTKKITTSYEKLTLTDTTSNDQGEKSRFERLIGRY
jgi:viroplasmin and RNaseH domain-containing protein